MLQEVHAADQQSRSDVESQLKAMQESARLDLERVNALSEENVMLKVQCVHSHEPLCADCASRITLQCQRLACN